MAASKGGIGVTRNRNLAIRIGVVSLFVGLLAASNFYAPAARLWEQHPTVFQLVSDAMFLAATYLVVDELIRRREARSWSDFARVCFRTLAQEAEDVRHRLKFYLDATSPRATIAAAEDDFAHPTLKQIIESVGPGHLQEDQRLDLLLSIEEWRTLTYVGIRWIKRENWALVQRIAPILLTSENSRPLLGMFSGLHDQLVDLERLFEDAAQQGWSCCDEKWKQEVSHQWKHVISTTHQMEHELHSNLTGLAWYSSGDNKHWWFHDHQRS